MELRITVPGKLTVNEIVRKLGRILMFLYVVASFVTTSNASLAIWNRLTLYTFVLLGLASFVVNKGLKINNVYVIWYAVFCVLSFFWAVISLFYWSQNAWGNTFYQMIIALLLGLSFTQFVESKKDVNLFAWAYVLGAVLLMALLASEGRLEEDERLGTTTMGNANTFATMFMVAVIMGFWLLLNNGHWFKKILLIAAIITIFYGLLLSAGRKFILTPFMVLYIMLLFRKDKRGRNHIIFYSLLVIALVAGLFWLMMENDTLYEIVGYRMEYLLNMVSGEGEIGASNRMRKELMQLAFERGFESPIWGHGLDSFKNLAQRELNFYAYSHNNWVEIWYNYGIIGLVVYYWFYAQMVLTFWKVRKDAPDMAGFSIACVVSIFIFEYGAVSYYMYPVQTLLCITGAMYTMVNKQKEETYGEA